MRPSPSSSLAINVNTTAAYQWTNAADVFDVTWPELGIFATTCSCSRLNPTGSPEGMKVVQAYDRMLFR